MTIYKIKDLIESKTNRQLEYNGRRTQADVYLRAVYCKLCREFTETTLTEIGASINKHHSSVLHCLKIFNEGILLKEYYFMYDEFKTELKSFLNGSPNNMVLRPRNEIIKFYDEKIANIHREYRHKINTLSNSKEIMKDLALLNDQEIENFRQTRLKPYLSMLGK